MELSEALGVTVVTIRRDLNELEDGNYLKREHGYAIVVDEDDIESRMLSNFSSKQALAEFAAGLVEKNECIFIEGGSTNALLARLLTKRDDITIITMSTYISNLLKDSPCNVILLGGMLQKHSEAMVGPITRASLQLVHFSKAFIGIDGYTPQGESVNILLNFTQFFETRIEYRFQIFTAHSCDFLLPSYARLA